MCYASIPYLPHTLSKYRLSLPDYTIPFPCCDRDGLYVVAFEFSSQNGRHSHSNVTPQDSLTPALKRSYCKGLILRTYEGNGKEVTSESPSRYDDVKEAWWCRVLSFTLRSSTSCKINTNDYWTKECVGFSAILNMEGK